MSKIDKMRKQHRHNMQEYFKQNSMIHNPSRPSLGWGYVGTLAVVPMIINSEEVAYATQLIYVFVSRKIWSECLIALLTRYVILLCWKIMFLKAC